MKKAAAWILILPIAAIGFCLLKAGIASKAVSETGSLQTHSGASAGGKQINVVALQNSAARIPVLMFHSINTQKGNPYRIPKTDFAADMKWLHDNAYQTLTMDALYHDISQHDFPKKSVVLTFDDGYEDNYTNAFPILKQYHFNATLFMITDKIGGAGYLTAAQLKEMDENGFCVECHTVTHPHLSGLPYQQQYSQLADSKAALQKLLNKPVDYLSYPYGNYNSDTIKAAKQLGYQICFLTDGNPNYANPYKFPRIFVGQDLRQFIDCVEEKGVFYYIQTLA